MDRMKNFSYDNTHILIDVDNLMTSFSPQFHVIK